MRVGTITIMLSCSAISIYNNNIYNQFVGAIRVKLTIIRIY